MAWRNPYAKPGWTAWAGNPGDMPRRKKRAPTIPLLRGRIEPEVEDTRDPYINPFPTWPSFRTWPDRPREVPAAGDTYSPMVTSYAGQSVTPTYSIQEAFGRWRPRDPGLRSYDPRPGLPGWGSAGWAYGGGAGRGHDLPPYFWSDIPLPPGYDDYGLPGLHPYYPPKLFPSRT